MSLVLLDQQEAALNSLSQLLPVNVIPQEGGQVLLATGGAVLLDQSGAQTAQPERRHDVNAAVADCGDLESPSRWRSSDGTHRRQSAGHGRRAAKPCRALTALATIVAGTVNTAQAEGLTPAGAPGGRALLGSRA